MISASESPTYRQRNQTILLLWRQRMDTKAIADTLGCHESVVANALPSILEGARK